MDDKLIMVVDDDPGCRYSLEAVLRSFGFSVISGRNGVQAVDLAVVHQPKLIFMDLMMPEMDGYTATRAIHARHTTAATPIVGLSANSDPQQRFRAREAGMVELVPKPWKVSDIQRILSKL
jgi:CheY-like chemotaxis protein